MSKSTRISEARRKKTEFISTSDAETEIDEYTGKIAMPSLECSLKCQATFIGGEENRFHRGIDCGELDH